MQQEENAWKELMVESQDLPLVLVLDWMETVSAVKSDEPIGRKAGSTLEQAFIAEQPIPGVIFLDTRQIQDLLRIAEASGKNGALRFAKQIFAIVARTRRSNTYRERTGVSPERMARLSPDRVAPANFTDTANQVAAILDRWGDEVSNSDKYDSLLEMMFPFDESLSLGNSQADLLSTPPQSIFSSLVRFASGSGRLADLETRLEQLVSESPTMIRIDVLVLQAQLAVAKGEPKNEKRCLEELLGFCKSTKDDRVWKAACYAAIPALSKDELLPSALPIVEEYLKNEKRKRNIPEEIFQDLPLVKNTDEHVRRKIKLKIRELRNK
jgi:hypothetical protein